MFTAIFNLILCVLIIAVMALWVLSLVNSDGKCHSDTCDGCLFDPEECPGKGKKDE